MKIWLLFCYVLFLLALSIFHENVLYGNDELVLEDVKSTLLQQKLIDIYLTGSSTSKDSHSEGFIARG